MEQMEIVSPRTATAIHIARVDILPFRVAVKVQMV